MANQHASVAADLQIGPLGLPRAFCRGGFRPPSWVSLRSGRFPKRAPFDVTSITRISRNTYRAT
jgi:hypothetical protein